jgi:hypothetical protein
MIKKKRHEELAGELSRLKEEFMQYANEAEIDAQIWFDMAMRIEKAMSMLSKIREVE